MHKEQIIYSKVLDRNYSIIFKSNIKNINLRVKPFKGIVISAPPYVRKKDIEELLFVKKSWIENALIKVESKEANSTFFSPENPFSILGYDLVFKEHHKPSIEFRICNSHLELSHPKNTDFKNEKLQNFIRKGIEKIITKEASTLLKSRTKELAIKFKFSYNEVNIKPLKGSWGNCSTNNNITLSSHLIRLPKELQDYVILHELCHTLEKNHGKKFWELLNIVTSGKAIELRNKMKVYSPKIF